MNVSTLEAALPALTVALLTDVTLAGQVSTGDERPTVDRTGVRARWAFSESVPATEAGGLGRSMHGLRYTLQVTGPASQSARRAWAQEVHAGLHLQLPDALLGVSGLDHVQVLRSLVGPSGEGVSVPGGAGMGLAEIDVLFVGDVLEADAATPPEPEP